MAKDYYRVLRKELKAHGLEISTVAELCGCSASKIYKNLAAHTPWSQDDIYIIMDALNLPYSEIPAVFPRGGMYTGEIGERSRSPADKVCEALIEFMKEANLHDQY